ncbi:Arc family DNA-binding protein [Sphingopyxis sp. MG]|nr:Arc family DNA-binding protein [Sphingopyxis sp. MG]AVA13278.1 antitoxin [Sphingopyxis sp. MG]
MKICDIKLRLPADLKAMLKERADANHRKMNGEIIAILERVLTSQREAA